MDFLSIGVPTVRQDLDLVDLQHLLCRHGYGVQHVTVVDVVIDVVMNNQAALYVHHALEIVRRHPRRTAIAHRLGLWLAEDEHLFFATLQLLLPSDEPILPVLERSYGGREILAA